jgi:two-component system chemotaxis response regulator CheY
MKRCIFVDGSPVVRQVAKRILSTSDFYVVEAATGQEALSICTVDMPDFIVVDANLPDMAAPDFVRGVRTLEHPIYPQIILCLTEMDIGAIMRAKRAGAQSYLLKPFDRAQLLECFRTLHMVAA